MKVTEIRDRAKSMGVHQVTKLKKGQLIRRIQQAEGNFDCFGSAGRFECPQQECCWRDDCLTSNPG